MKTLTACLLLTFVLASSASAAFTGSASAPASEAAAAPVFRPKPTAPPTITGTPRVFETLTAKPGTWTRQPGELELQWLRCDADGAGCREIAGATAATYELAQPDETFRLRVRLTTRNAGGQASVVSAPTEQVRQPPYRTPPIPQEPPTVSGVAALDELLRATPGTWLNSPHAVRYQWQRCDAAGASCADLPEEQSSTYRTIPADAGATLRVRVTAENKLGATTADSMATSAIATRTYRHVLCAVPRTGHGLVPDGRLPDGMSTSIDRWEMDNIAGRAQCSGTMTLGRGIPIRPHTRVWGPGWAQTGATLKYRAPSSVSFQGATVYRRLDFNGAMTLIGGANGSAAESWVYGVPEWERCELFRGCATSGFGVDTPSPFAQKAALPIGSSPHVNGFNMFVRCGGADNTWHCGAEPRHGYTFYGGVVELRDPAPPRPTAPASGGLADDPVLEGVETVRVAARDDESGLYRLRVEIDAETVAVRAVHTNDGRCVDVDPGGGDAYEFATATPCINWGDVTEAFDTSAWPKGSHRLTVRLEDAGRNTTAVVHRSVVIGG